MIVLAELVQIVQIRERVQSVQTGTVQPSSNLARKRHVRRWRDSAEFDCFGEHFSITRIICLNKTNKTLNETCAYPGAEFFAAAHEPDRDCVWPVHLAG